MSEMKNTLEGINSLDREEEMISDLEDKTVGTTAMRHGQKMTEQNLKGCQQSVGQYRCV
jgi:hypothetical protein